jgi:hypothetical protein
MRVEVGVVRYMCSISSFVNDNRHNFKSTKSRKLLSFANGRDRALERKVNYSIGNLPQNGTIRHQSNCIPHT